MGKPTGFLEYARVGLKERTPSERLKNFEDFHLPLSEAERQRQGGRCMDCGVPFCQAGIMLNGMVSGCPLHNLTPEWNDLLYTGNWQQAYNRLNKTNNFPEFTSRVCPAPCEAACTCGMDGDPVTIRDNERAICDHAWEAGYVEVKAPRVRTGKRIAIVGSGPSGLAAADQLNKRGHEVTVFEREDRIGGLLMYGIPNMKLDKKLVERRVELMKQEGVHFVTGADVGHGYRISRLRKEFDSVILCCGASKPRDIEAPGRDAAGIYFAVDFLKSTTKSLLNSDLADGSYISAKDKHVLVIGGGDTGNDCVGTCMRHGCAQILQLEMMPEPPKKRTADNSWPEYPRILKTDYGQQEAKAVFGSDPRVYQTTVKEFLKDENGNVRGAVLVKLKQEKDEASGRMVMVPVEGSEWEIQAELVLIAAGFLGAENYAAEGFGVELDGRLRVKTENDEHRTQVSGIYAAGDMRRGQSLVVWAIREGRNAAREVDEDLMGYSNLAAAE